MRSESVGKADRGSTVASPGLVRLVVYPEALVRASSHSRNHRSGNLAVAAGRYQGRLVNEMGWQVIGLFILLLPIIPILLVIQLIVSIPGTIIWVSLLPFYLTPEGVRIE